MKQVKVKILPAGTVAVVNSLDVRVMQTIFLLKWRNFKFTIIQMLEDLALEVIFWRNKKTKKKKHEKWHFFSTFLAMRYVIYLFVFHLFLLV